MVEVERRVWSPAFKAEVMATAEECGLPGEITDDLEEGFSFFTARDTVGTDQDGDGPIPPRWNLEHDNGVWRLSDNGRHQGQWNAVAYRMKTFSTLGDAMSAVSYARALTAETDKAARAAIAFRDYVYGAEIEGLKAA